MSNAIPLPGHAVIGCTVTGPGHMTNFGIDGERVFKKVTWKKTMRVRAGIGLICDGRKRVSIASDSYWGCHAMDVSNAVVVNEFDVSLITSHQ